MWIQEKWSTLKEELWNQCMSVTRMDCKTFSQQERQMYLMLIFNCSNSWACCVQAAGNNTSTAALLAFFAGRVQRWLIDNLLSSQVFQHPSWQSCSLSSLAASSIHWSTGLFLSTFITLHVPLLILTRPLSAQLPTLPRSLRKATRPPL